MTETREPALERRMAQAVHAPTVGEAGHGNGRVSSWLLIAVVITAFAVGGAAIILHIWPLLWACVAVAVLAVPLGKAMRIMDDTVTWHDPLPEGQAEPGGPRPSSPPSRRPSPSGRPPSSQPPPTSQRPPSSSQRSPTLLPPPSAPLSSPAPPPSPDPGGGRGRRNKLAAVPVAMAAGAAAVTGWLIRRRTR
jgi:Family of unknown function (DUF6704)